MIQNITGVVFIIFHIICCVLVWTGINSHLLKVKRYLILPVIFVPVWGQCGQLKPRMLKIQRFWAYILDFLYKYLDISS